MYFPQFAYATMRVFVDRNVYPTITNLGVAIDVDEATVMGSQIYAVNAFDADLLDGVSLSNFFAECSILFSCNIIHGCCFSETNFLFKV